MCLPECSSGRMIGSSRLDLQCRVAQERLGITPDEMPGGHLVALSRPKELAERLAAYAADLQAA